MADRFFVISVKDEGTAATELNGFLRSRRVLAVDRRWVEQGAESFWSFCVDYLESGGGVSAPASARTEAGRVKVE